MPNGFTLIELVIVLAISSIIGGFTLILSLNSYRSNVFRNDLNTITSVIARARAKSIEQENGDYHGVKISSNQIILFAGRNYSPADSNKIFSLGSTVDSQSNELVFAPLTGSPITSTILSLQNGLLKKTISVNSAGAIETE